MRRIALRTGPAALFGAMLVVALFVYVPMRAVLGWFGAAEEGLVARRVSGSIWGATLGEARFGELALGDLHARLALLPLAVGRATLVLAAPGGPGAPPLSGRAFVSRHASGVEALTARIGAGAAFQPLPVVAVDLDRVTVRFEDGRCQTAEGRVRAMLAGDVAGIALPPTVEGTARCEGGALLLALASAAGSESVVLRVSGDGRYRADLSIRSGDPLAMQRLEASGFVGGAEGHRLSVEGRL